jgi:hypothetical protein
MIDWFAIALSIAALFGILRWKWNVIAVVAASGIVGLLYRLGLGA